MKLQHIKKVVSISTLCVLFAGCGTTNRGEELSNPTLSAALPLTSEPFQQQTFNDTNYIGTNDQQLGFLAQVPRTQTASIPAYDDFAFDASQFQSVNFSLPETSNQPAEATFCTEYSLQSPGQYPLNYNSCVLTAPVLGGVVDEELNLVNQHDTVIGVVSFQDPSIQPIYQEFHFD